MKTLGIEKLGEGLGASICICTGFGEIGEGRAGGFGVVGKRIARGFCQGAGVLQIRKHS